MARAKFGKEHQPHNFKASERANKKQASDEAKLIELAAWRGLTVGRMNSAGAATGDVTSKRKPHSHKAHDSTILRINSSKTGKPVKSTRLASEGTFIQFGARSKEGQLETRKAIAPGKPGKPWKQGYTIASQRYSLTLHDGTNGERS